MIIIIVCSIVTFLVIGLVTGINYIYYKRLTNLIEETQIENAKLEHENEKLKFKIKKIEAANSAFEKKCKLHIMLMNELNKI